MFTEGDTAMPTDGDRPTGGSTAAVLGARGFIGRAVVSAFEREGIRTTGLGSLDPAVTDGELHPAIAAADSVVLVTGRSNPALAENDASTAGRELAESRELFTALTHAAAGRTTGQRVFLASSGGAVYDTGVEPPYREDSPTARSSAYAALKLDIEEAFLDGASAGSQRTVLRLSNVYGPGQRLGSGQGVVGHWLQAMVGDRPVRLFGDPATIRDYVYIDDVAAAFLRAHGAAAPLPSIVNVGSGEPTSLEELLKLVLQAADRPQHPVEVVADRPFDRRHTWLDVSRAQARLGWRPEVSLAEGLRRTWQRAVADQASSGG
jgi:UDP-glucose 4-epimerase